MREGLVYTLDNVEMQGTALFLKLVHELYAECHFAIRLGVSVSFSFSLLEYNSDTLFDFRAHPLSFISISMMKISTISFFTTNNEMY